MNLEGTPIIWNPNSQIMSISSIFFIILKLRNLLGSSFTPNSSSKVTRDQFVHGTTDCIFPVDFKHFRKANNRGGAGYISLRDSHGNTFVRKHVKSLIMILLTFVSLDLIFYRFANFQVYIKLLMFES